MKKPNNHGSAKAYPIRFSRCLILLVGFFSCRFMFFLSPDQIRDARVGIPDPVLSFAQSFVIFNRSFYCGLCIIQRLFRCLLLQLSCLQFGSN